MKAAPQTQFPERPRFLPFSRAGACFDMITDSHELVRAFGLRYKAYIDCNYISLEDYPLGWEFDDYDDLSVHFVARDLDTAELVGYVRLILDVHRRLQIDKILKIPDYRQNGTIAEMSRLISYPRGRPKISAGLRYAAFRWAQLAGIETIVGVSLEREKGRFDRMRFLPMEPYRRCQYTGDHFRPLRMEWLYGNVFDLKANGDYITSLLS